MYPQDDLQRRHDIIQSIQKLDASIVSFNREKQQLLRELKSIPIGEFAIPVSEKFSLDEEVRLFEVLFRGRTDVYAKYWISRKTGKSGYSPVCKNEWVPKIYQRLMIKCSNCSHRELMLFDESVILRHLNGNFIAGIYPLLDGDTCYFLALDFDKDGWQDNVSAFRQTCFEHNVPVAVERFRSGNGPCLDIL